MYLADILVQGGATILSDRRCTSSAKTRMVVVHVMWSANFFQGVKASSHQVHQLAETRISFAKGSESCQILGDCYVSWVTIYRIQVVPRCVIVLSNSADEL